MELIAAGRDATVYAYADGLVLRRYGDGRSAVREAEVLRDVHALGYPVPALHSTERPGPGHGADHWTDARRGAHDRCHRGC